MGFAKRSDNNQVGVYLVGGADDSVARVTGDKVRGKGNTCLFWVFSSSSSSIFASVSVLVWFAGLSSFHMWELLTTIIACSSALSSLANSRARKYVIRLISEPSSATRILENMIILLSRYKNKRCRMVLALYPNSFIGNE